jgi:hypothetical protein
VTRAMSVLFVVGNGLTVDLLRHKNLHLSYDSRSPLAWRFDVPRGSGMQWPEAFPALSEALGRGDSSRTDFERLSTVARRGNSDEYEALLAESEARQFLAFAYGHLQSALDASPVPSDWPWLGWMRDHREVVHAVVSFNYDLAVERLLEKSGIPSIPYPCSTEPRPFFFKPHGSTDYAMPPDLIKLGHIVYPANNVVTLNDTPIVQLRADELGCARREAFITLPLEESPYREYQWAAPGFRSVQLIGPRITHAIFVGLSYWAVDRPELDTLLDFLTPGATVVEANPAPVAEFASAVRARRLQHVAWLDGPRWLL